MKMVGAIVHRFNFIRSGLIFFGVNNFDQSHMKRSQKNIFNSFVSLHFSNGN